MILYKIICYNSIVAHFTNAVFRIMHFDEEERSILKSGKLPIVILNNVNSNIIKCFYNANLRKPGKVLDRMILMDQSYSIHIINNDKACFIFQGK